MTRNYFMQNATTTKTFLHMDVRNNGRKWPKLLKGRDPLMKTTMAKKFTRIAAAILAAAAITISAGTMSVSADTSETGYDSQFLNDMGVCPDRWGGFYTAFHWGEVSGMTDQAWARMGVRSVTNWGDCNEYYINGKKVKREEAYDYVAKKLGRTYDKKKYSIKENSPTVHKYRF
jgi:hypothetical protein